MQRKQLFYAKEPLLATQFHAKDTDARVRAIFYLAASAPPDYDPDYYEVFSALFGHPDPKVRMETVAALGYPDWPELRPLLEQVAREAPFSRVREAAREFLDYKEE
jgi:HEAT repeat protein